MVAIVLMDIEFWGGKIAHLRGNFCSCLSCPFLLVVLNVFRHFILPDASPSIVTYLHFQTDRLKAILFDGLISK